MEGKGYKQFTHHDRLRGYKRTDKPWEFMFYAGHMYGFHAGYCWYDNGTDTPMIYHGPYETSYPKRYIIR